MKVVQLNLSTGGGGGGGGGGGDAEIVGAAAGAVAVDISVKDPWRLLRRSQAILYHQKSPKACQTRRTRGAQMCEIFDPTRASIRYSHCCWQHLSVGKLVNPISDQSCMPTWAYVAQDIFAKAFAGPRMLLEAR